MPGSLAFDARVEVVEYLDDEQLVHLTHRDTSLLAKLRSRSDLSQGQKLTLSVARDKVHRLVA